MRQARRSSSAIVAKFTQTSPADRRNEGYEPATLWGGGGFVFFWPLSSISSGITSLARA